MPQSGVGTPIDLGVLLFVIFDCGFDRVFCEHRAVDLDRGEREFFDDLGVLDVHALIEGLALEPLGGER